MLELSRFGDCHRYYAQLIARERNTRKSFSFSTCHFIYHVVTIITNYSFCFWNIFLFFLFFFSFKPAAAECPFEIHIAVFPLAAFLYIINMFNLNMSSDVFIFLRFFFPFVWTISPCRFYLVFNDREKNKNVKTFKQRPEVWRSIKAYLEHAWQK